MDIQLQNLKIKGELGFQIFYFCLVASDRLNRHFNADSRKSVPKFSGLRWFLFFKDLYNGEGSLQANKPRI